MKVENIFPVKNINFKANFVDSNAISKEVPYKRDLILENENIARINRASVIQKNKPLEKVLIKPELAQKIEDDDFTILLENDEINPENNAKTIQALNNLSDEMLNSINKNILKTIILHSCDEGTDIRVNTMDKLFIPEKVKNMQETDTNKKPAYRFDENSDECLIAWLINPYDKTRLTQLDMLLLDIMKDCIKSDYKTPQDKIDWLRVLSLFN